METGAEIFGDHLGSWGFVRFWAGWALSDFHKKSRQPQTDVAGNLTEARRCFEGALAMDDTFAETHGGLAVLAQEEMGAEGRREDAARHAEVARRLAKGDVGSSLGAALAEAMRLTEEGQEDAAKALVQRVLGLVLRRG